MKNYFLLISLFIVCVDSYSSSCLNVKEASYQDVQCVYKLSEQAFIEVESTWDLLESYLAKDEKDQYLLYKRGAMISARSFCRLHSRLTSISQLKEAYLKYQCLFKKFAQVQEELNSLLVLKKDLYDGTSSEIQKL